MTRDFGEIQLGKDILVGTPANCSTSIITKLRNIRIKRQHSTYMGVIPKLMVLEWMKQLYKVVDVIIQVLARHMYYVFFAVPRKMYIVLQEPDLAAEIFCTKFYRNLGVSSNAV